LGLEGIIVLKHQSSKGSLAYYSIQNGCFGQQAWRIAMKNVHTLSLSPFVIIVSLYTGIIEGIMSFKKLPDNRGLIYVPNCKPENRKNPCPGCFSCQWCGNERCRLCREKAPQKRKTVPLAHPLT
jgi:hypothetical protein